MKLTASVRACASLVLILCLLAAPAAVLAKKGEKNYKRGLEQERAMQWERAAQEFALAVAANPSDIEYQLHYRRAIFNASQRFMEQGRTLAEQGDFTGAYNAYRQAVGYDPINELAVSEMERMLRLQREKEGRDPTGANGNGANRLNGTPSTGSALVPTSYAGAAANGQQPQQRPSQDPSLALPPTRSEQLRVINYNGDLEGFIRKLGDELSLNVLFDRDFPKGRTINVSLKDVTSARALDHIFLSQNLFFQKLDRRTIIVADQSKRGQYQQLVLRTFYLSNIDPNDARSLIQSSLPPTAGRQPQVTPNKATNSITVRDTPENIRLIAELLQAIDKDRAEVVMDVNIYEVSRTNLLQLGNQLGTDATLGNLGGLLPTSFLFGGGKERFGTTTTTPTTGGTTGKDPGKGGSVVNTAATVLGGAFLLPATTISAFQAKDNTRLLAATQVHAFDSEQSTTRIGQKVPVQTAQVSPFGSTIGGTTGTAGQQAGVNSGLFGGTGYPVIQYQDTGLILKFTPQVFPNLDVQVKMEIESNDVIGGASNLTPTFSQRNVSGMARIPNNRTMMIASVAQDKHSEGRRGVPLLGLIPVLGRLFSTPTRNDVNSDIVITVTPRVLRAPTVSPGDIDQRPSGTLQAPVSESLEALLVQADREDQLAAARALPKDVAIQMPAAPADSAAPATATAADAHHAYVPAPKALMGAATPDASNGGGNNAAVVNNTAAPAGVGSAEASKQPAPSVSNGTAATTAAVAATSFAPVSNSGANVSPVPAANVKPNAVEPTNASLTTNATTNTTPVPAVEKTATPDAAKAAMTTSAAVAPAPLAALTGNSTLLYVLSGQKEMRVGEKQRLMVLVKTSTPLGLAAATLRFDPRVLAVRGVTHGSLFGEAKELLPTVTPSIDPRGSLLALIAPAANTPINGMGVLLFVEVEAIGVGESDFTLDQTGVHLMSVAGQNVATQLAHTRLTVKQ